MYIRVRVALTGGPDACQTAGDAARRRAATGLIDHPHYTPCRPVSRAPRRDSGVSNLFFCDRCAPSLQNLCDFWIVTSQRNVFWEHMYVAALYTLKCRRPLCRLCSLKSVNVISEKTTVSGMALFYFNTEALVSLFYRNIEALL